MPIDLDLDFDLDFDFDFGLDFDFDLGQDLGPDAGRIAASFDCCRHFVSTQPGSEDVLVVEDVLAEVHWNLGWTEWTRLFQEQGDRAWRWPFYYFSQGRLWC